MKPFYRQNHEIVHIKMTVDFKGFSVKINRFLEKTIRIIFLRFYHEEMSENCECVCREHFLTQKWHSDKKDFEFLKFGLCAFQTIQERSRKNGFGKNMSERCRKSLYSVQNGLIY